MDRDKNREEIEEIYERLLARDYARELFRDLDQVRQVGPDEYKALCPFHAEKDPSFTFSTVKPVYNCFGCGKGGDWISYLIEKRGLSFPEAKEYLAKKAGAELRGDYDREAWSRDRSKANLLGKVLKHYQDALFTDAGKKTLAYLMNRGYTADEIGGMELGHYLGRAETAAFLKNINAPAEFFYLEDRDEYKAVIPYRDPLGNIKGLWGRLTRPLKAGESEEDSYKPLTRDADKATPFNLDKAKLSAKFRDPGELLVVEGYFDALAVREKAGLDNVVALGGPSITKDQLETLRKYKVRSIVLALAGDTAGRAGIERALELLAKEPGIRPYIAELPDGLDPDDYIRTYGPDAFRTLSADPESGTKWRTGRNVLRTGKEFDPNSLEEQNQAYIAGIVETPFTSSNAAAVVGIPSHGRPGMVAPASLPPGRQGPQGIQGPKGDTGAAGATGPPGAKGDAGAVGPGGPKGDRGIQGSKGDTGAAGARGPAGAKGDTGAEGPAGPKGDAGARGPAGPQGPQGIQGPPGPIGPAGPQGPAGAIGPQGPVGPRPELVRPGVPDADPISRKKHVVTLAKSVPIEEATQWLDDVLEKQAHERLADGYRELFKKGSALLEAGNLEAVRTTLEEGERELRAKAVTQDIGLYTIERLAVDVDRTRPGLRTGYKALDEIPIRIPTEAVTIIAGRPTHGKTAFLMNLILKMVQAKENAGRSFFFFSYEETRRIIGLKLLNILSGEIITDPKEKAADNLAQIEAYLRGKFTNRTRIEAGMLAYRDLTESGRLQIIDEPLYVDDLADRLAYLREWHNIGAVFIDYIQKIKIKGGYSPRQRELQKVSERILETAKELSIPIIMGSQLSRDPLHSDKVRLDNLREAADIEQDANLVLGLYNEAVDHIQHSEQGTSIDPRNINLTVTVLKNRNGPVNAEIGLTFDGPLLTIKD